MPTQVWFEQSKRGEWRGGAGREGKVQRDGRNRDLPRQRSESIGTDKIALALSVFTISLTAG